MTPPRGPGGGRDSPGAPLVAHGWRLLVWTGFRDRWTSLRRTVEALRERDAAGYVHHPATRFLRTLRDIVLDEVPANPAAAAYLLGNTLGPAHRAWRRVSFHGRFRLYFRFSTRHRIIVYAWLNDEGTLRKDGARSDRYIVFRRMLERGAPPTDWEALIAASADWAASDVP